MLSKEQFSSCDRAEALRDYAFDELQADERRAIEQHLAGCGECALELDRLRLTTAALRTLPDREIPQRIAFVSDRVLKPSLFGRWFSGFWNSAGRLGFASACVLAVAVVVSAWHISANRPTEVRTIVQTASVSGDAVKQQINDAVARVRIEDAKMTEAAIQASERKQDQAFRNQMVAMEETYELLQKRLGNTMLAANDIVGSGVGQ